MSPSERIVFLAWLRRASASAVADLFDAPEKQRTATLKAYAAAEVEQCRLSCAAADATAKELAAMVAALESLAK